MSVSIKFQAAPPVAYGYVPRVTYRTWVRIRGHQDEGRLTKKSGLVRGSYDLGWSAYNLGQGLFFDVAVTDTVHNTFNLTLHKVLKAIIGAGYQVARSQGQGPRGSIRTSGEECRQIGDLVARRSDAALAGFCRLRLMLSVSEAQKDHSFHLTWVNHEEEGYVPQEILLVTKNCQSRSCWFADICKRMCLQRQLFWCRASLKIYLLLIIQS